MMRILAIALKALAWCFRQLPLQRRVALLSRQSSKLSLDYQLLSAELAKRLDTGAVTTCLTEPETKNLAAFATGTVKQLFYACTSKVVVVDGYVPAVSIPSKDPRVTIIQTWHALGAIKKFGYQCLDTPAGRSSESARVARMHKNYDWIIAGGPGAVPAFAKAFGYPEEKVLPLGLPRIDYLLDRSPETLRTARRQKALERLPFLTEERPITLYAPTLRKGEGYDTDWLTEYVRELAQQFAETQEKSDALLVVAGHPLSDQAGSQLLNEFPFLRFARGVVTIDLLEFADTVVTDYSAVAFEAAVLGKPVKFFTPDLERYQASPGLNISPIKADAEFFQHYLGDFENVDHTSQLADLIVEALNR